VTYNDVRRHQFLADLANPNIPLSRLMLTSVPHGFKGVELFETMFSPPQPPSRIASGSSALNGSSGTGTGPGPPQQPAPIPIDRALWFIRVLGANEISMHRGRAQTSAVSAPVAASPMPATPSSTATAPAAQVQLVSSSDWYTGEFTIGFSGWLRNQLAQLNLPAVKGKVTPTTTGPPAKAPAGVLGDEKARARWLAKWDYR
jgi:mediator of RNA polymerase II transcription subunit 12